MGVTIKDVAKKSGVSVTTVSLVLNNKSNSRISEKTRQLITDAANELNYVPNKMAVSLVTKKTQTIGLIIPSTNSYYFADLIKSVEAACRKANYFLMLCTIPLGGGDELEFIKNFIHRGVDGIIYDPSLFQDECNQKYINLIESLKIPLVTLGYINSHLIPNSIAPDYYQGSYIATSHLLELNHRRIGCIVGTSTLSYSSALLAGYRDALEEREIVLVSSLIIEGDHETIENGYDCLDYLLSQNVTAIFSSSDVMAYGIYRRAREKDLQIPRDLSIVGFKDILLSSALDVPLTTVSLHVDRIARKAVNRIRKMSESEEVTTPEIVPPSLILRESTSKPIDCV